MVLLAIVAALTGCGGRPPVPARGVVESDLGSWKFRRFQGPLLDVEVWVDGNKAEAYTASYITADAEKRGRVEDKDLVSVFVTRYTKPDGVLRATVKLARRLAQEGGYQVDEEKIAGARTLTIVGRGEAWVMWPSNQYVVKVGGRGLAAVPSSMVERYVERFPSQLPGGSLEGALPGPEDPPKPKSTDDAPKYDAGDPRPNIDNYDPNKVKLPDSDPAAGANATDDAAAKPAKPADEPKPRPKKRKKAK